MKIFLKFIVSLVISIVLTVYFRMYGNDGLFQQIEARFFNEQILSNVDQSLERASVLFSEYQSQLISDAQALIYSEAFQRSFEINQNSADITLRSTSISELAQKYPAFIGLRFVDEDFQQIHYSSRISDIENRSPSQISYSLFTEVNSTIDPAQVDTNNLQMRGDWQFILNDEFQSVAYVFPVFNEFTIFQGWGILDINVTTISNRLISENLIPFGENIFLIEPRSMLLNGPNNASAVVSSLRNQDFSASQELIINIDQLGRFLVRTRSADSLYYVYFIPISELELSEMLRIILSAMVFVTAFLLILLILNIRRDKEIVITDRIRQFQLDLLKQAIDQKNTINVQKWQQELRLRKQNIIKKITQGLPPRIKKKYSSLIEEHWEELLNALVSKNASLQIDTSGIEQIAENLIDKLEITPHDHSTLVHKQSPLNSSESDLEDVEEIGNEDGEPVEVLDLEDSDDAAEPVEVLDIEDSDDAAEPVEVLDLEDSDDEAEPAEVLDIEDSDDAAEPVEVLDIEDSDDAAEPVEVLDLEDSDDEAEPAEVLDIEDSDDAAEPAEVLDIEDSNDAAEPAEVLDLEDSNDQQFSDSELETIEEFGSTGDDLLPDIDIQLPSVHEFSFEEAETDSKNDTKHETQSGENLIPLRAEKGLSNIVNDRYQFSFTGSSTIEFLESIDDLEITNEIQESLGNLEFNDDLEDAADLEDLDILESDEKSIKIIDSLALSQIYNEIEETIIELNDGRIHINDTILEKSYKKYDELGTVLDEIIQITQSSSSESMFEIEGEDTEFDHLLSETPNDPTEGLYYSNHSDTFPVDLLEQGLNYTNFENNFPNKPGREMKALLRFCKKTHAFSTILARFSNNTLEIINSIGFNSLETTETINNSKIEVSFLDTVDTEQTVTQIATQAIKEDSTSFKNLISSAESLIIFPCVYKNNKAILILGMLYKVDNLLEYCKNIIMQ